QPLAFGGAERGERARDPRSGARRAVERVRGRSASPLPARSAPGLILQLPTAERARAVSPGAMPMDEESHLRFTSHEPLWQFGGSDPNELPARPWARDTARSKLR